MNEPVNPDVRVYQCADVDAVANGLLRHANQPGGAVEHNRVVHVLVICHHLSLAIHKLPRGTTL